MATIKQTIAPITDPLTLEEVKLHLRIDDNNENTLINNLIKTATSYVEKVTNKYLMAATYELYLDGFPTMPYIMPRMTSSIVAISYKDINENVVVMDINDFVIDNISIPSRIAFKNNKYFPAVQLSPLNGFVITFTSGNDLASGIPQPIKDAMLILIAHLYENRESAEIPEVVNLLLYPYRLFKF